MGDVALAREMDTVSASVPADATFESLLRANQVDGPTATAVVASLDGTFNPRALRAGQPYRLTRELGGAFREFRYEIDVTKYLRVTRATSFGVNAPAAFDVHVVEYPRDVRVVAASAEISRENNSLSAALDHSGETIQLALLLSDVFGGEVDFNSDLQRGDRFEVLFERVFREGQFVGYGEVSAAVLKNAGRTITAIRAIGPDGRAAWYDEHGRSMKRQFRKSPLQFDPRITSRFSMSRVHPVHGGVRAHLGVDYGAPTGSPVVAVASGTVISADWAGDGGRMIRLRHTGGYETYYLHLSAFAPGLSPGDRIEQGDIIGRVGASGAVTGPHLDFRMRKNGVFVNPILEQQRMPKGEPIPASLLPAFEAVRDRALGDLARRIAANLSRAAEN
jgi:murein DD-endopeptidase MepM/ murein hydrolase activator NlpD